MVWIKWAGIAIGVQADLALGVAGIFGLVLLTKPGRLKRPFQATS